MTTLALSLLLAMASPGIAAQVAYPQAATPDERDPGQPRLSSERAVLHTDAGDIVVAFYPDVAPRHTEHVLRLMRLGAYETTHVHRVEPAYLVQVSDVRDRLVPLTPEQAEAVTPIQAELSDLPHRRGVLSMAHRDGDPDSAETSFSILLADAPHLDGHYTVFGEVVAGFDALYYLTVVPRTSRNAPLVRVQLRGVTVVDAPGDLPPLYAARPISVPEYLLRRAADRVLEPVAAPASTAVWGGVSLVVLFSLAGFVQAYRHRQRALGALFLLSTLVCCFVLFSVFVPLAQRDPWIGVTAFLGALALFRLMGWFESVRRP